MDVKTIKELIPDRIKKLPNYRLFLVWAQEADAKTVDKLRKELDGEIQWHQTWLRENGKDSVLGMKNHWLRAEAKYLDFLKSIKSFFKYL